MLGKGTFGKVIHCREKATNQVTKFSKIRNRFPWGEIFEMFALILSQIIAYNDKKCVLLGDVELYVSSKSRLGNLNVYSMHNLRHT